MNATSSSANHHHAGLLYPNSLTQPHDTITPSNERRRPFNRPQPTPRPRQEIFYYQLMEVSDFRNDVILAEACRQDVEKYCKDVEPGEQESGYILNVHGTRSTVSRAA
jgi:hypothetical protein